MLGMRGRVMCLTELSSNLLHYLLLEGANSTRQGNDHIRYRLDLAMENRGSLENQSELYKDFFKVTIK